VSDPRLYGIGYLVVSRCVESIGIEGLHELCVRAEQEGLDQVPASWMLEPAGLTGDDDVWRAAIAERMGINELLALGRSIVPELVELLVVGLRPHTRARSGAEFLSEYRPRLGVLDGTLRVPLVALPGFRHELSAAWPSRHVLVHHVTRTGKPVPWSAPLPTRSGR
jgi:hypothetical protein